jgi:hypothetical protein
MGYIHGANSQREKLHAGNYATLQDLVTNHTQKSQLNTRKYIQIIGDLHEGYGRP